MTYYKNYECYKNRLTGLFYAMPSILRSLNDRGRKSLKSQIGGLDSQSMRSWMRDNGCVLAAIQTANGELVSPVPGRM